MDNISDQIINLEVEFFGNDLKLSDKAKNNNSRSNKLYLFAIYLYYMLLKIGII
jgi:hypothetical protein